MPAAETKPTGESTRGDGQRSRGIYGTPLGSNFLEDPVQGVVRFIPERRLAWLRGILAVWVGILAATILMIATNAGPHRRIATGLLARAASAGAAHPGSRAPDAPDALRRHHRCSGRRLPHHHLPGSTITLLADLYAFGAMISFTVAHISVVVLRFKEPDTAAAVPHARQHPVREPALPVLAHRRTWAPSSCGASLSRPIPKVGLIGFIWMAAGLITYVVYRRAKGYSLTRTVAKVIVPESMQADIDYNQILVPITGSRVTDEMMVLGLPAGDREEVRHRRPLRHRGAAQPAARRAPRARA